MIIKVPIMILPMLISYGIVAYVSVKRIQEFLNIHQVQEIQEVQVSLSD